MVANAVVNPGDVVVADVDGVVVVPRELVGAVADASQKREDNEEAKRVKFREGALGLDVYGMRGPLAKAGLEYAEN
ncbi:4-hydroxy-4-methyl-2-oxoglutarate aldolase/4-carboxy-4-hydroxy-2-oxoadipate aldolase [compost metagenome]